MNLLQHCACLDLSSNCGTRILSSDCTASRAKERNSNAPAPHPTTPWARLGMRDRHPELMDQPGLVDSEHRRALAGLRRINWLSRAGASMWSALRQLTIELSTRPVRVLDLACGAGDVGIDLTCRARRAGLVVELTGCDISYCALEVARERAQRANIVAQFISLDLLRADIPDDFDVVMCSLFLHHLDDSAAVNLLSRMAQATRHLVLVDDLVRSQLGYLMAWTGCRLLTRSSIVHTDGPLSVRAAFTPSEVLARAREAGLTNAVLTRHWPQRYLLAWRRC